MCDGVCGAVIFVPNRIPVNRPLLKAVNVCSHSKLNLRSAVTQCRIITADEYCLSPFLKLERRGERRAKVG